MARLVTYVCTGCGEEKPRSDLTVKRVQFATMGAGYKTLKSRTTAWLCNDCRDTDPAWTQSLIFDAPGMVDTSPSGRSKR
jgi:hypothetical protein